MRRSEKEIKDSRGIEEILRRAQVCRVAMCDDGEPYIVPVCFAFERGAVFIHSAREGRKIDILRSNPRVCFEVETDVEITLADPACRSGAKYRSVIGTGRAVFVENPDEKRRALDAIMLHYSGRPGGYPEKALAAVAVVRIDVERMTGKCSGF